MKAEEIVRHKAALGAVVDMREAYIHGKTLQHHMSEDFVARGIGPSFMTKTGVHHGDTASDMPAFIQRPTREYDTSLSDSLMQLAIDLKAKKTARLAEEEKTKQQLAIDVRADQAKMLFDLVCVMFSQCVSILEFAGEKAHLELREGVSTIRCGRAYASVTTRLDHVVVVSFVDENNSAKEIQWQPERAAFGSYADAVIGLRRVSIEYAEETIRFLIDPVAVASK